MPTKDESDGEEGAALVASILGGTDAHAESVETSKTPTINGIDFFTRVLAVGGTVGYGPNAFASIKKSQNAFVRKTRAMQN